MNRKVLRSKLAKIILELDKIIFDTSKQTCERPEELARCKKKLVRLLSKIEDSKEADSGLVAILLCRVVNYIHSLVS